ncbi:MAG: hypothetical protein KC431_01900, partial [Myxococcales bacterium]|nr:hypothetical protein [Myxococcales bacterium]
LMGPQLALGALVSSQLFTFDRGWAADLDGDGRSELLTSKLDATPPKISVWTGSGDGALGPMAESEIGSFEVGAVGRVDDDDRADFLAGLGAAPLINPWLSQGDGTLASGTIVWPFTFSKLAAGDLDGDGRVELLSDVPGNDWRVSIYANVDPAGLFAEQTQDLAIFSYGALRSADVDGDGRDDVIVAPTGAPPRVTVIRSIAP